MDVRRVRMMAVRRVRMTAAHSRLASLRHFRWLVASDDTQSRLPVALTLSFGKAVQALAEALCKA